MWKENEMLTFHKPPPTTGNPPPFGSALLPKSQIPNRA